MSQTPKKVLFFIKSPSHNLKSIELFLSKRNFNVQSESDIKDALTRVIELQPDFIFLAWDHANPIVSTLPRLIAQASLATIVPYIMSNSKEASRKFNLCTINPKLYPPLSGPAIERLVLKAEKQNSDDSGRLTQVKGRDNNKKDLNNIKSLLVANLESLSNGNPAALEDLAPDETEQLQQQAEEKNNRRESLEKRSSILRGNVSTNLTTENIEELKKSFESKVKQPLENLINTLKESQSFGEVTVTETEHDQDPGRVRLNESPPQGNGGVIIQQGFANPQGLGTTIQKNTDANSNLGSIMQEGGQNPESLGLAIQSDLPSASNGQVSVAPETRAYCMSVYSENWCGYLVITTAAQLDFSSIDMIFTDWIKLQFNNMQEVDESDFFEFRNIDPDMLRNITEKADYFESLKINDYDLNISFFPMDSNKMNIELNDDKSLIKVLTEDIPADNDLDFSLHLHLPENKKYLLYTQASKSLSYEQKKRLIANKIFMLYTPLDFEKEYKKHVIERNMRELYQNLNKKYSGE